MIIALLMKTTTRPKSEPYDIIHERTEEGNQ